MRLLIVEDEAVLRDNLAQALESAGYVVDKASDGREGLYKAKEYPIDLAIVDLGLPELSGMKLIEQLREDGFAYPILILTARDYWQDKVDGLDAGADDYVTKPFHTDEVIARITALLRRSAGFSQNDLTVGPVTLDLRAQTVTMNEQLVDLTGFEYRLLETLMLNTNKVMSKSALIEAIYAEDTDPDSNVLEVLIARLRSKLDPDKQLNLIETLRGRGYRFKS
ncbi:MAG: response regulator transcription factor [Gammaproteobacteria bacterium]|nr:response regulator transcription factor [Gammaproteobacteria bacterium]